MTDEEFKRAQYIKLRSKMLSILGKTNSLKNKKDSLKSTLKLAITIDNYIYNENELNIIDETLDNLIKDQNSVISSINSIL